jgi:hypothetical protein
MSEIQLVKELVNNSEWFSSIIYDGSKFFHHGFFGYHEADEKFLTNEIIKNAYYNDWDISIEQIPPMLKVFKIITGERSSLELYKNEIQIQAGSLVKDLIVRDPNSSVPFGSYLGFNELETVEELQEYGKKTLFGAFLLSCLAFDYDGSLSTTPALNEFDKLLVENLNDEHDVLPTKDDMKKRILRGFRLKTDVFPFVLTDEEKKTARNTINIMYGL